MTDQLDRLKAALAERYTIERELGRGGMAVVYLAHDQKLNRQVALKVLRPELAASLGSERFLREIEIAAKLAHPNILALHDCGGGAECLYYTMPYVEGESLRDRLHREKQLSIEDALQITKEVAEALGYAHSLGIVHRDIKPENILFTAGHAVVSDFGIARAVSQAGGESLTETGLAIGTPAYMSPEQGAGSRDVDARSDIYSLGCVLYEMLSGETPYLGNTPQAIVAKKLSEPPPRVSVVRDTVTPSVEAALTRALSRTPADRFATAEQFAKALAAQPPAQLRAKRPVWHWIAAVAAAAIVVAGGAMLLQSGQPEAASGTADEENERLVVVPFENRTGDLAAGEWAFLAAELITRAIDRAGVMTVVPATVVRDLVREADLSVAMPLDQIATRTRARYAVAGSYALSGGRLRFEVELVNAESGRLERSLDPVTGPADSLEAVLTALSERITAATVAQLSPGLSRGARQLWSSPPTLDALQGLLVMQDHLCSGNWQATIDEGRRLLREAPDFAPPLLMLAYSTANLGRLREADSILDLIEPLSDQLSRHERLLGQFLRGMLAGDHSEATRAAEQAYRISPSIHAGFWAEQTNRFTDALERLLPADTDDPCARVMPTLWTYTARPYHMLGRYREELDLVRDGRERFPSYRGLVSFEAYALAGLGRLDAVDSLLDVIAELPSQAGPSGIPGSQMARIALELDVLGYQEAAQETLDRALAWFTARPADSLRFERAQAWYWAERWSDVDTMFVALLENAPVNLSYRGPRGVTLAHLGHRDRALEIDRWLEQLERPYLLGTNTKWRAAIAAALGNQEKALQLLQQAYSEGMRLGYEFSRDPEWKPLRDYRPYQQFVRPRG